MFHSGLYLLIFSLFVSGCQCEAEVPTASQADKTTQASLDLFASPQTDPKPSINISGDRLLERLSSCRILQDGIVLQLGVEESNFRNGFSLYQKEPVGRHQFGGVAVRRFSSMRTRLEFWTGKPIKGVKFDAWARGIDEQGQPASTRIAAYIDGKRVGGTRLNRSELKRLTITQPDFELAKGRHELLISLSRPKRGQVGAEIAWARISATQAKNSSDPLLFNELHTELQLGSDLRPALILKKNSRISCPIYVSKNARFKSGVALWGRGQGKAVLTVIDTSGLRKELWTQKITTETDRLNAKTSSWTELSLDLSPWTGQLVELEFSAQQLKDGLRLAFSNPTVAPGILSPTRVQSVSSPETEFGSSEHLKNPAAAAQRVIVIILAGLNSRHFVESSAQHGFSVLNRLAREGLSYSDYRATTTWSGGVIASLLTETPSWVHQLNGPFDSLPRTLPTLAEAIQSQGGRTAFFTSVPSSFSRSGLNRGFEEYAQYSPVSDISANAPVLAAGDWLKRTAVHKGPVFTFLHMRGGHPPFDITREQARELAPVEYGGDLTPRRSAIQLSAIRMRSHPSRRVMQQEDWQRFEALQKAALTKQSQAIAELIEQLQQQGLYESTTIVIAGDVNAGEKPHIPFATKAPLTTEYLRVPLVIKFAGQQENLARRTSLFAPRDLAATLRNNLGLQALKPQVTAELNDLRKKGSLYDLKPFYAYRNDSYSTFWGPYVLRGREQRAPDLFVPFLDPQLKNDRTMEQPLVQRALWTTTYAALSKTLKERKANLKTAPEADLTGDEPYDEDDPIAKAMIVWGIPQ